jgi:hypothetical protein
MSSFGSVPERDIDFLIRSNNLSITGNKYLTAWNFLITNPKVRVPKSIADWINNYNMSYENVELPSEIILKIILNLDNIEDVYSICSSNRLYTDACNFYVVTILKHFLTKMGAFVENINDKKQLLNIFRMKELQKNNRDYLVDNKGNAYQRETSFTGDTFNKINISNVITVSSTETSYSSIVVNKSYFLCNDGTVKKYNESTHTVESLNGFKNIIQISSGKNIYLLDNNGSVYKHDNPNKILLSDVVKIAYGNNNYLFLTKGGNVFGIGDNHSGQLCTGGNAKISDITQITLLKNVKDILVNYSSTCIIDNTDKIWLHGGIESKLIFPILIGNESNIKKIDIMDDYLVILRKDHTLKLYGIFRSLGNNNLKIIYEINNIKNIIVVNNTRLALINNNNFLTILYLSHSSSYKSQPFELSPNFTLLSNDIILIDNMLYTIEEIGDKIHLSNLNIQQ